MNKLLLFCSFWRLMQYRAEVVSVEGFLTLGPKEEANEFLPPQVDAFKLPQDHVTDNLVFLGGTGSMFAGLGQNYLRDQVFRKEAARTGVIRAEGKLYLGFGMFEVARPDRPAMRCASSKCCWPALCAA